MPSIGLGIGIHRRKGGAIDPDAEALALLNDGNTWNFSDFTLESTITKDGSTRVSEVTPVIGDASHALKQAGADNVKPVWSSEGLTFDGVRQFMATDDIAMAVPYSTYIVFKQLSWTVNDVIIDGVKKWSDSLWQRGTTPELCAYATTVLGNQPGINVNEWGIARILHSAGDVLGLYSFCILNNEFENYGSMGANNDANGITLGRTGSEDSYYAHIKVAAVIKRIVKDTPANSRLIYSFLNSKFNLGKEETAPITGTPFNKGKLVFTFDDSSETQYINGFPVFESYGVHATFYQISGLIGNAGICTWAELIEMEAAGHDIGCHTKLHVPLNAATTAQTITELNSLDTDFIANGLPKPDHHAYPLGGYGKAAVDAMAGLRLTARTHLYKEDYTPTYKNSNKLKLGCLHGSTTIDEIKAYIDFAAINHCAITIMSHSTSAPWVTQLIDYAISKDVDVVSMSELYALMDIDPDYWDTKTPTNLYATVYRDTEADLTWTDPSGGRTLFKIYQSTDGVNYTAIGTTIKGDNTYTATGLTAGVVYYFYVVGYFGTNESPASNIIDTYFKITVDTTKAGSAADTFILPVTAKGSGNYYVKWGDGSAEETFTTIGNKSHTYDTQGSYQVKVSGSMTALAFANAGDKLKLITIDQWGNIAWSSVAYMFHGCANMQGAYLDIPNFTNITSQTRDMFAGCTIFDYSVAGFINSNITTLTEFFSSCSNFNQSVSTWDTSNVSVMVGVFGYCYKFNQSLSTWNTAKVTSMNGMFYQTTIFNQSLSTWNTAKVTDMFFMFGGCTGFKQSLASFNMEKVSSLVQMLGTTNLNETGTTTNYDNTLISWAAQDVINSQAINCGTAKYGEGLVDNGTTDGAAASKLIQSGQNFVTTVTIGDVVYNTTDGTYALVTAVDSDTQLSISANIMASGEVYRIQHGAGAKARASLIIDDLWTITDGGYL